MFVLVLAIADGTVRLISMNVTLNPVSMAGAAPTLSIATPAIVSVALLDLPVLAI